VVSHKIFINSHITCTCSSYANPKTFADQNLFIFHMACCKLLGVPILHLSTSRGVSHMITCMPCSAYVLSALMCSVNHAFYFVISKLQWTQKPPQVLPCTCINREQSTSSMAATRMEITHGPTSLTATAMGPTAWQQTQWECYLSVHQWLQQWGLATYAERQQQ